MRKEYHGLCYVQSVITSPSSSPTLIIVSVSVVVVVVIIIVDSTPCSEHSDYFHIFPESTSQVRSNYPSEGHIFIPCSVHSVNFRVFPESQIQSTSELIRNRKVIGSIPSYKQSFFPLHEFPRESDDDDDVDDDDDDDIDDKGDDNNNDDVKWIH